MTHEDINPAAVFGAAARAVRLAGPTPPFSATADWLDHLAEAPTAAVARGWAMSKELGARRGQMVAARASLIVLHEAPEAVAAIERANDILGSWAAPVRITAQRSARGEA